jgi:DNA polymerase-1
MIVDGRHLLFRNADVNRAMVANVDGETVSTGGVFGFMTTLMKLKRRYRGQVVIAWEGETRNFRYGLWPTYKKKPPPTDEMVVFLADLNSQERQLREILSNLNVKQFDGFECEADDVVGTLASRWSHPTIGIFSGDSDLRQLVTEDDRVFVLAPGKKGADTKYGHDEVIERHGVPPCKLPALKALAGDSSDNIPGVPGVGDIIAARWISQYGDIESVIAAARDNAFTPKKCESVLAAADNVRTFLALTEIRRDVRLISQRCRLDVMKARRLMRRLEFKRLLDDGSFSDLKQLGYM